MDASHLLVRCFEKQNAISLTFDFFHISFFHFFFHAFFLAGTYSSTYDCYRQLMEKEGPKALVKGQGVAFLRAFPLHATIFFMYEVTMKFLKDKN